MRCCGNASVIWATAAVTVPQRRAAAINVSKYAWVGPNFRVRHSRPGAGRKLTQFVDTVAYMGLARMGQANPVAGQLNPEVANRFPVFNRTENEPAVNAMARRASKPPGNTASCTDGLPVVSVASKL